MRLAYIDSPETSQSPYGIKARQALKVLLPVGSDVTIRNGSNINQSLVESGNAFVYWQYIKGCHRQTYSRLETYARLGDIAIGLFLVGSHDHGTTGKADRPIAMESVIAVKTSGYGVQRRNYLGRALLSGWG